LPVEFYNNILYPLQDKAIPAFKDSPFYLTGGTALSRGYYNHRYSDDLDYFVNDHADFIRIAERQIGKLNDIFSEVKISIRDTNFCRIFVAEEKLKIEMINDVPAHIGTLVNHPVLGIIDSKENILANKITAIADRALPKDIVDAFFLLRDGLDIKRALLDAESKAAGISPLLVAKILAEFDYSLLDSEIKWVTFVSGESIKQFMNKLSLAIVEGKI
jgi:predicted nucleotidyltransferase component of viral defense system